jgi:mRNA-degrading endonuclease toxin of MazEF toxin-antitoxin module
MPPTDPHSTDGNDEPFRRSHVVFVALPEGTARPFVVLNTDELPDHGERYLGVGLTIPDAMERATPATDATDSIAVHPNDWTVGGPERTTYAVPAEFRSFSHASVERGVGALDPELVDVIAERVGTYLGLDA